MRIVCTILVLALLAFTAFSQESTQIDCSEFPTARGCASFNKATRIDCSQFSSPACPSFKEMVSKLDAEITDVIGGKTAETAFVCFRELEDVFLLISYTRPIDRLFSVSSEPTSSTQFGFFNYRRVKNGVSEDRQSLSGRWRRTRFGSMSDVVFEGNKHTSLSAFITDTEVMFSYSFKNLNSTTTQYGLTVRRSTLRFSETYEWFDAARKPGKRSSNSAGDEPKVRLENGGHCEQFN